MVCRIRDVIGKVGSAQGLAENMIVSGLKMDELLSYHMPCMISDVFFYEMQNFIPSSPQLISYSNYFPYPSHPTE
jgi:hypothetical protein